MATLSIVVLALLVALLLVLAYTWGLFSVLLAQRSRRAAPPVAADVADDDLPRVCVVLSAHNEAVHIAGRVQNLLTLDYPADRLRACIGVDGATDATADEAHSAAGDDPRIKVRVFVDNRGKVAVLRDLVAAIDGDSSVLPCDVLVFTDANTQFEPRALRLLASHFRDERVGGVCGRLVLIDHAGVETHEDLYWRWETWLKQCESRLDSCLGANGAIYAIRRELFWRDIPENTIIDDFVLGMKVREQGWRMIYEPAAMATEALPETVADEWTRRVRIGAGAFQALVSCRRCLVPRHGVFAWCFWSHKVLRWVTPHVLIVAALLAVLLSLWGDGVTQVFGAVVLLGGAGLAVLAACGRWLVPPQSALARLFRPPAYFFAMQVALFAGFLRFCRGGLSGRWERTRR